MKRRSPRMWLGVALSVCAWLAPLPAGAAEPTASHTSAERAPTLRLLLLDDPSKQSPPRGTPPSEPAPELGARLRGQLSDLAVSLDVASSASNERTLAHLEALATRHSADVIVWLSPAANTRGGRGSIVSIWMAHAERIYSRRIGPSTASPPAASASSGRLGALDSRGPRPGDVESSATLEAAALVVRGAVRSVLLERASRAAGVSMGSVESGAASASKPELSPDPAPAESAAGSTSHPTSAPVDASPVEASPVDASDAVEAMEAVTAVEREQAVGVDTPSASASDPSAAQSRVLSRVGAEWSTAGLSRSGALSANLALLLRHGRVSAGVGGSWGLPEVIEQQGVALTFSRRTLTAELGMDWPVYEHLALRPTLKAGAAWLSRTSRATASGRQATPGQLSLSPMVALGLALDYELTDTVQLGVSSGVSWLSHTSRYVLAGAPGVAASLGEPWHWQPNAGIALGAQF